jgi:endonuclease/exonuclease/phosphatase (EEP) superfamily protein YafD
MVKEFVPVRLANVHLDSVIRPIHKRTEMRLLQVSRIIAHLGPLGIVAGDFNPLLSRLDRNLLRENGLVDAWLAIGETEGAYTWKGDNSRGLPAVRSDKVAFVGEMQVARIERLEPGQVPTYDVSDVTQIKTSMVPWTDHCGLLCTLAML